jgi:hypothetical protein
MRRLVVASAILVIFLTMPLGAAAASPTATPAPIPTAGPTFPSTATDSARATAALSYLLAAQSPDGSIDKSLGETADYIIGAAAAGYDPATLTGCTASGTGALAFLANASDGATTDAAKTGKAILAVVAAGVDPAAFSGRNLVARLAALYHADTGAYGDGSTFAQAFAILAVDASGGTVLPAATAKLAALQDGDGSWSYGKAPVAAGGGDTNSTGIALMALHAAGVHTADSTGFAYLATQQLADGGFPYQNSTTYGTPASDPVSDSIVLQALVAAGQDPASGAWSKGSANVLTSLRASQINDGGFFFPGSGESAFTTSQVPAALAGLPYGAATNPKTGKAVPSTACPNYVPVASASASMSAVLSSGAVSSAAASSLAAQTGATAAVTGHSSSSNGRFGGLDPLVLLLVAVVLILLAGGGLWFYRARSRPR